MEEVLNRPIDRLLAYLAGNEEMIDVAHGLLAAFDAAEELASKVDLPPGFHTGRFAAQMAKAEATVLGCEQEEAERFWREVAGTATKTRFAPLDISCSQGCPRGGPCAAWPNERPSAAGESGA